MGGLTLPGGIEPEAWDTFHSLVLNDELNRCVVGSIRHMKQH